MHFDNCILLSTLISTYVPYHLKSKIYSFQASYSQNICFLLKEIGTYGQMATKTSDSLVQYFKLILTSMAFVCLKMYKISSDIENKNRFEWTTFELIFKQQNIMEVNTKIPMDVLTVYWGIY